MVKKRVPVLALRDRLLGLGVVPYGARLLVGVSGGIDSTALLHILYDLRHDLALDIVVAHYDHALRRGSMRDRLFVAGMARRLGLACAWERNKARPPKGVSVEEFARERRFGFFVRTARALKATAVALGQTQDDLAETVLMRLFRGTALGGLRSILFSRRINGVVFLRPMLEFTRGELEVLLRLRHIPHIEDPTNASDLFLRNRIRRSLIPYIARNFAPAVKKKLAEAAILASADHEFLENEFSKVLPGLLRQDQHGVVISRQAYLDLPPAFQSRLWREGLKLAGGSPEFDIIDSLAKEALKPGNHKRHLSRGLLFETAAASLRLRKA